MENRQRILLGSRILLKNELINNSSTIRRLRKTEGSLRDRVRNTKGSYPESSNGMDRVRRNLNHYRKTTLARSTRSMFIAYGLLRGRSLLEIEPNRASHTSINTREVASVIVNYGNGYCGPANLGEILSTKYKLLDDLSAIALSPELRLPYAGEFFADQS